MFYNVYNNTMARFYALLVTISVAAVGCGGAFTAGSDPAHGDAAPQNDDSGSSPDAVASEGGPDSGEAASGEAANDSDAGSGDAADTGTGQDTGGDGDADAASPTCLTSLSNAGAGDFSIHFTLTTTAGATDMALFSQRVGCDETSSWWDVSYIPSTTTQGALQVATCDGSASDYVVLEQTSGPHPDDGQLHKVVVTRISGQLSFMIDGVLSAGPIADANSFSSLPALKIGTDDCPGFVPTIGNISDVCITVP